MSPFVQREAQNQALAPTQGLNRRGLKEEHTRGGLPPTAGVSQIFSSVPPPKKRSCVFSFWCSVKTTKKGGTRKTNTHPIRFAVVLDASPGRASTGEKRMEKVQAKRLPGASRPEPKAASGLGTSPWLHVCLFLRGYLVVVLKGKPRRTTTFFAGSPKQKHSQISASL